MWGTIASIGFSLYQGQQQKKAANKAAGQSLAIGAKNADIIERDIDIANRQIQILYRNLQISNQRKRQGFSAVQGTVRNVALGSGVTSRGTVQDVMLKNVAEFNYELAIDKYNTDIAVLEQEDLIEETKLRAEVARMGGAAEASTLRARGQTALLQGVGQGINLAADAGMFSRDYWSNLKKDIS
ncbi:MAG: hypothetical protein ACPGF7_10630 [Pontibacterium sp.]